jgi:ABC-2 type transport system permease protein/sodium transport system permease protein
MKEYLGNGRLWRLCQKELRESLRDRRTIVTLVLMPILVYPLLSMALQRLLIGSISKSSPETAYIIAAADQETGYQIQDALIRARQLSQSGTQSPIRILRTGQNQEVPKDPTIESPAPDENEVASKIDPDPLIAIAPDRIGFRLRVIENLTPHDVLQTLEVDLAVSQVLSASIPLEQGEAFSLDIQVEFREGDSRSEAAMSEFRRAMQLVNDSQFEASRKRIDARLPSVITMRGTGIGSAVADMSTSIAGVIPLVLILMTITGAVYPAIDLTAGERERGTMEALIATPAPRFALLLSKYVAVVCVAILTALANLFATWMTLSFGGLGQALLGKQGFSIWMLVQILPLLVIFASFFSAILLALCSFARSFKEAQAYLIPVMLLSLGPGLITLMPNVEFTSLLGVVPLVNILLLSRDIMLGQSELVPAFAAVFSTIIYACATLVVASRLFGAEAATAGSQETWSELLGRPKRLRSSPTIGELAIYLAILFPVFFIASNVGGMLSLKGAQAMFFNAILLFVLFLAMPLFFALYRRLDWKSTFLIRFFTPIQSTANPSATTKSLVAKWWIALSWILSVVLLGCGMWMVAFEAYLLFESWSLASQLTEEDRVKLKETFLAIPFWVVLLTGAVAPAIAEEFFFRGFALSAFRTKLSPERSVLYSAILFGVFHIIAGSVLSLEKFAPTIILGVALGTLAVRTGCLWPGILLHMMHNALVFSMTRISESELEKWLGADSKHLPISWMLGGVFAIGLGFLILFLATRQERFNENSH